ncbi:MAG: FecR domain-containing protein [Verrucomicrobia bacterium]|nr:FecR domain-containing protein [Verrucomicrobiota bacterium]
MKDSTPDFNEDSQVEQAAAEWVLRIDRGLTAQEQDDYTEWLVEDPSHREAMALFEWGWEEFDRLAGLQTTHHAQVDPDLLAPGNAFIPEPKRNRKLIAWMTALPVAAALALTVYFSWPTQEPGGMEIKPAIELMARIEQRLLEDGSKVEINRGAVVEVVYSANERRVNLTKGEANFKVAKDPGRPFIVNVAGVDVRAVGTIFSVKLSNDEVGVIVTEGKVSVLTKSSETRPDIAVEDSFLGIGQRGIVKLNSKIPYVEVTNLSLPEIEEVMRWQPRLLDFDSAPLGLIVEEFNRSNPIQVVLGDPSLEMIKLSSSFWSDNVEGFVRLMESSFGMKADWRGSREIVLREAQ